MNVLIAANYASPFGGNFIGSMLDLAAKLRARGDNIAFLFPKADCGERDWAQWIRKSGFETVVADLSGPADEQLRILNETLEKYNIDLLHLHFELFQNLVRTRYRELRPVKIVIHDHMGYATGRNVLKQKARLALFSRDYAKNGFGLITVMRKKKNAYIFMRKKWYVANGLSLLRNVDHFATREETRKALGIQDDEILCTLFGWDMKRKGVDIAVQAISKLREQGHNVILGIIGGSKEGYSNFIRSYGVDPDNPWIHYIDSREDVFSLHRAADVFLSLSRNEGFPYGILEAVSQNTPVVISDIQETKWALDYTKTSIYPVEDPVACAEAILRSAAFGYKSSNAAEIIDRYSIDKWCEGVMEVYDAMLR